MYLIGWDRSMSSSSNARGTYRSLPHGGAAGGEVYLEPDSIVTYVPPPPLTKTDLPYFLLRWSHAWNLTSVERFRAKWNLDANDPGLFELLDWLGRHRRIAWHRLNDVIRLLGRTPARWIQNRLIEPLEQSINCRRYPAVSTAESSQSARRVWPRRKRAYCPRCP